MSLAKSLYKLQHLHVGESLTRTQSAAVQTAQEFPKNVEKGTTAVAKGDRLSQQKKRDSYRAGPKQRTARGLCLVSSDPGWVHTRSQLEP